MARPGGSLSSGRLAEQKRELERRAPRGCGAGDCGMAVGIFLSTRESVTRHHDPATGRAVANTAALGNNGGGGQVLSLPMDG